MQHVNAFVVNLGNNIFDSLLRSNNIPLVSFDDDKIKSPLDEILISVIVGVTNIIPYFGPFIGAIPAAVLIFVVSPSKVLGFIIFITVLQQIDGNILGPKILGSKTGLSSFWVLLSLLIFGGLFGIVGMIIGVPILSILYSFVNGLAKKRLSKKNLPLDSKDYEDLKYIDKKTGKPVYNK